MPKNDWQQEARVERESGVTERLDDPRGVNLKT